RSCAGSSSAAFAPWSRRSCGATRSRVAGRRTERSPGRFALAPSGSELVNALETQSLQALRGRAVRIDENVLVGPVHADLPAQLDAAARQVRQRAGYLVVLDIGTGWDAARVEVEVVLVVEHLRARRDTPLPVEVVGEVAR